MHFHQVCLTALAFSTTHGGTLDHCPAHGHHLAIRQLGPSSAEIVVEQDLGDFESWQVRLQRRRNRLLHAPVRFPPVRTQEELLDVLSDAWRIGAAPPAPFLTRFLEPPIPPPKITTPPRSASPPRPQTDSSPRTAQYHE
jgi:hypothetical protein